MGLLDQFTNTSDDQNMGLLSAGLGMMAASGPSRMPTNFGQIALTGLQGYQGSVDAAKKRKVEDEQQRQLAQIRAMQIQEAQGGLDDHARARQQADLLRQFYMQQRLGQAPTATPDAAGAAGAGAMPLMASSMPGGPNSPKVGGPDWMQSFQAGQPPAPAASAAAPQAQSGGADPYAQRMGLAQQLRGAGFHAEADAQEAAALKFKPKFANEPRTVMGPNGKPVLVQMADDGTVRPIEGGYGVAEKLAFQNIGGKTLGVDPYTGSTSVGFQHTQTPDSIASNNLSRERLNFDRSQTGKPTFNADAGGFISPPSQSNPQGLITPLPGFSKPEKAPTEFQGKSAAFGLRATEADKILNDLNGKYSPAAINSKQTVENTWLVGGALGAATNKFALNGSDQRAEQAQRDFVNAVLRQESGAAIGAQEFDNAKKQYFPQPGDGSDVIAQKATNRRLAIQGFDNSAGRAAMVARPTQPTPMKKSAIKGQVTDGYRFKGGDPADQNNWEQM